jgi:hypothetical protein
MRWLIVAWNWTTDHATVLATVASSLAAKAVGVFTYFLVSVTKRQAELSRQSIDLAQGEFNATHRPEIVVHSVEMNYFTIAAEGSPDRPAEYIGAFVTYYNKGSTDAIVEEIRCKIHTIRGPLDSDKLPPTMTNIELLKTIESGLGSHFAVDSTALASNVGLLGSDGAIFVIGRVWYADMRGAHRQTGFIRKYGIPSHRRERVDGSAYEYAY